MAGGEGSLEGRPGIHGQAPAGLCWAGADPVLSPLSTWAASKSSVPCAPWTSALAPSSPGEARLRGWGGVWCVALCWEVRVVDSATVPSPFPAWGAVLRRVRAIWGGAQSQLCPRLPVTHGLLTPDDLLETTAHPSESVWVPRGVLRTPQHVLAPGGRCCWLPVETQGRAARGWEPVQGDQGMSTVPAFFLVQRRHGGGMML